MSVSHDGTETDIFLAEVITLILWLQIVYANCTLYQ